MTRRSSACIKKSHTGWYKGIPSVPVEIHLFFLNRMSKGCDVAYVRIVPIVLTQCVVTVIEKLRAPAALLHARRVVNYFKPHSTAVPPPHTLTRRKKETTFSRTTPVLCGILELLIFIFQCETEYRLRGLWECCVL